MATPPLKKKKKPLKLKTPSAVKEEETEVIAPEKPKYANLRQIMDYRKPFEIIYSGVENESYYDILYGMGVRNFLMSYHYIQSKHINMNRFSDSQVRLFIDSGAHTYQNDPKYADMDIEYWEKHLTKYLNWVERNRDYIFAIASFDFENLVGPEIVDRWNKEYFEPFMLRTGIPVCFVWHQNSYNSWEYYCKRYPYVGFSSVNTEGVAIDMAEYKEKLRVAEMNDSLVHGFGMTRTNMLTELPFYTSDSTTWLVGLQYGEMNYWSTSSNKMSRLKKDKWQGDYLEEICQRYNLDEDKLLDEDVTEVIKANVGAFQDAEEFVKDRLKSMMYWLKAKAQKVDLGNLPEDFFPPASWFDGDKEDLEEYARKMNLNPEYEDIEDLLYDVTAFMNWDNPDYQVMHDWYSDPEREELIEELHDTYINRIVPDLDAKIEDLRKFFSDCVSGNNDKLLQLGTNFDRIVKERDDYIEDEEEELVDLSPEELKSRLHGLLPAPSDESDEGAPEIDSLDEEIYKERGIIPTFDEKGRFVKGQVAVRKPKKVYSKKYPKFACDTCYAAAKCPEYKAGYVCAYHKTFNKFDTRDMADIIQAMQGMVEHNMTRMQRAMVMEVLNGSIDQDVTDFIDQNMRLMTTLKQMYEYGSPEVLRQTRVVRADGSHEETTEITNPQSGGILEKLFGNISTDDSPKEDVIEVDAVPVKKNARYENIEED